MNWTSLNLRNEMANNTETRTPTQIQKDVLDLKVPEVSGFWIGNALFLGGGNKLKSAFHNVAVMLSIFFNVWLVKIYINAETENDTGPDVASNFTNRVKYVRCVMFFISYCFILFEFNVQTVY
ncbi:hypothetical protein ILYODFUR_008104 [Ilyodon furcidens]|uniref:Uncharacterized protein n=1 Tax=Ilyodon furcidens TaxID=33524 RepID=A0ABV0T679_9TELE